MMAAVGQSAAHTGPKTWSKQQMPPPADRNPRYAAIRNKINHDQNQFRRKSPGFAAAC